MNAIELVSGIIGAFFIMGVGVGIVSVIAMAARRQAKSVYTSREALIPRQRDAADWREPPHIAGDEELSDDVITSDFTRPEWPDTGYRQ